MAEPLDKPLLYNGKPYHHPGTILSDVQLRAQYDACGTGNHHARCLRCGDETSHEHRLNWLPCPRMQMTYAGFFTPDFFMAHAGVVGVPWVPSFLAKYWAVRDSILSQANVGRVGERNRQQPRDRHHARDQKQFQNAPKPKSASKSSDRGPQQESEDELELAKTLLAIRKAKRKRGHEREDSSPEPDAPKRPKTVCYSCRKDGHFARDCPQKIFCPVCRKTGHAAAECPDREVCSLCKSPGHKVAACPRKGACFNCLEQGHKANTCPKKMAEVQNAPVSTEQIIDKFNKSELSKQIGVLPGSLNVEPEDTDMSAGMRRLKDENARLLAENTKLRQRLGRREKRLEQAESALERIGRIGQGIEGCDGIQFGRGDREL